MNTRIVPPDPEGVLTVVQLAQAIAALDIDPSNVLSLTIFPDRVSYETVNEAGLYEDHVVRVARWPTPEPLEAV